jgi:hypothetical protein
MNGDDKLFTGESDLSTADLVQPRREDAAGTTIETGTEPQPAASAETERNEPLFPANEAEQLRGRWADIQASFVDEPRRAVQDADGLVAAAIKRMAETFAEERTRLEGQWDRGDEVSTEDLRVALRRYRSFFDRILSV